MPNPGWRTAFATAAALMAWLALATSASAIPSDTGGAVAPGETPAPVSPDPLCSQSYADDEPLGGPPIRFGIGPRLAGEVGSGQATPLVAAEPVKRDAALARLAGKRSFTVRLNRLFMSDGGRGIRRFQRMARHYASRGMRVEIQVRYHPNARQNGNIRAWVRYVRRVVRAFGPIEGVTGLQITNEVNLTISPNTSDGAYDKAVTALIQGVRSAKHESLRRGFERLEIGFNYAWLFRGKADADFWTALGRDGGKRLRRSTDWIGVDLYPGTYMPVAAAIADYGDAFLEGLAQVRECYMPMAGFGPRMPLRIEETGWPTGPGRSEAEQRHVLRQFVKTAVRYRGTYGLTDFRWFGLRDNNSAGPDYQSYFGLLDDAYTPKPAYGEYRRLVKRFGARHPRHPR